MLRLPLLTQAANLPTTKAGICLFLGVGVIIGAANPLYAEVIPDKTLPEPSNVQPLTIRGETTFVIEGGTPVGKNLFHSFQEFSLREGEIAEFSNSGRAENIFGRVTGGDASRIEGLIVSRTPANIFLLNPHGIIFGPNAQLNVNGSFIASTANSIKFADGVEFTAQPTSPTTLLTVTAPIGLQYGNRPGEIQLQGESISNPTILQSTGNNTLALIGGNIFVENSAINVSASGGKIELGAVGSAGIVSITPIKSGFAFNYDDIGKGDIQLSPGTNINTRGDIQLTGNNIILRDTRLQAFNNLLINATGNIQLQGTSGVEALGSGAMSANITVNAHNLFLANRSFLGVGGGNLTINAKDTVQLTADTGSPQTSKPFLLPSYIYATALTGNSATGNLTINSRHLMVKDGAAIISNSEPVPPSILPLKVDSRGSLTVNASESVILTGSSFNETYPSGLFTKTYADGDAGRITINTRILRVEKGGQVIARNSSTGKSGNITVNAADRVELIGTSTTGSIASNWKNDAELDDPIFDSSLIPQLLILGVRQRHTLPSGLFSSAFSSGDAGNIMVNTRELLVQAGGRISADTSLNGNGGKLKIHATQQVNLVGTSANGILSGLFSRVNPQAKGNAGSVDIATDSLLVQDGAQVSASTFGTGKGGDLSVQAPRGIQLIGVSQRNTPSGLFAQANRDATGNAGSIKINTSSLQGGDGAQVSASTFGTGTGGSLSVQAGKIELLGTAPGALFPTGLFAVAANGSKGDAGELFIDTQSLLLRDGAQVAASSGGRGQGGNLTIKAAQTVELIGQASNAAFPTGIFATATPGSTGSAGNLTITTDKLQIRQGAGVAVRSRGQGSAGNLDIAAGLIRLYDQAFISADTRNNGSDSQASQANINLRSQNLILSRGSSITTNATGNNVIGGNINIDTGLLVASQNSDISANSADFRGGQVKINAENIFGTKFRNAPTPESDITATGASQELSGTVEITTPEADPSQGLTQLPANVVDAANQIYQRCANRQPTAGVQNEFTITGRGGIPTNPYETINTDSIIANWIAVNDGNQQAQHPQHLTKIDSSTPDRIVEAQAWIIDTQGNLVLTAEPAKITPHASVLPTAFCSG